MRYFKWAGIIAGLLLIIICFFPWVIVQEKNITISGVDATGSNFGKPGYFNIVVTIVFLLLSLIQRLWAKRFNLVVAALNIAWAVRNFLVLSTCRAGDCPEKQAGLYIMLACSIIMLLASFFPDMELPQEKEQQ